MNKSDLLEVMTWDYGLVAVDKNDVTFHYVLFPENPSDKIIKEIEEELRNDPEFGIGELHFNLHRMTTLEVEEAKILLAEMGDVTDDFGLSENNRSGIGNTN